ncbi:uncharacterized protein isoform X2 [Leptinotarsa decemlineata]|uniref:uncharacterized protein isoform X2 n=1 Tax=Leptinotarsa decemlineata TaxID=7539 RepID=UPI003D30586C
MSTSEDDSVICLTEGLNEKVCPTLSCALLQMMDTTQFHDDILKEVTDDEMGVLADLYKNQSIMPNASNALSNSKRQRQQGCCAMRILSPKNGKEDGTFFVLLEYGQEYQIAVFTLDMTGETIYESLMETRRIEFDKPICFYEIHYRIYATIERVLKNKNMKVKYPSPSYIYSIPKEEAMLLNSECPDDVKFEKIELSHIQTAKSVWFFDDYNRSYEYVCSLIEHNGGVGLFLKSTNELVAWILKSALGELGLLHTLEKYRGRGFAEILVKELSRQIAQEGDEPTAMISLSNAASKSLAEKVGLRCQGMSYWFSVEKANLKSAL